MPDQSIGSIAPPTRCGELYVRLIEALAPRLRAVAPELPGSASSGMQCSYRSSIRSPPRRQGRSSKSGKLTRSWPSCANGRNNWLRGFERTYLDAVLNDLDYVEILGIEELDSKSRKADLTVAYISLTARLGGGEEQQKIDFATVLTLLPLFGNRLWIEGGAGSGKSTLVRWTALQTARWRQGGPTTRTFSTSRGSRHLAELPEAGEAGPTGDRRRKPARRAADASRQDGLRPATESTPRNQCCESRPGAGGCRLSLSSATDRRAQPGAPAAPCRSHDRDTSRRLAARGILG